MFHIGIQTINMTFKNKYETINQTRMVIDQVIFEKPIGVAILENSIFKTRFEPIRKIK